jgi:microcystin-dependent protein
VAGTWTAITPGGQVAFSGTGISIYGSYTGIWTAEVGNLGGYADAQGGNGPHNNVQPSLGVTYIIKAKLVGVLDELAVSEDEGNSASIGSDGLIFVASNPTGTIIAHACITAPSGYLLCDGASYSRTAQAALFAVIGTIYGAGDGSTTFNLPDGRGKTLIGVGQGIGLTNRVLAAIGGEERHQLTVAELASHAHTLQGFGAAGIVVSAGPRNFAEYAAIINTGGSGGDTAHNNMQPFLALNYIIKT